MKEKSALPRGARRIRRTVRLSDMMARLFISTGGIVLRTKVEQIKRAGRATMGVRVVNLKKGDTVAGVATIAAKDLEQVGVEAS